MGEKILSFWDSTAFMPDDERKLLLFILDFQDFFCPVCLESFLELFRRLPLRLKIQNSWGVLVVPAGREEDIDRTRIAEKKLKGFVRANQIISPFLVDRLQVFREMAGEGSCVVLFDGARRIIHMYGFPLRSEQFEEIFKVLIE